MLLQRFTHRGPLCSMPLWIFAGSCISRRQVSATARAAQRRRPVTVRITPSHKLVNPVRDDSSKGKTTSTPAKPNGDATTQRKTSNANPLPSSRASSPKRAKSKTSASPTAIHTNPEKTSAEIVSDIVPSNPERFRVPFNQLPLHPKLIEALDKIPEYKKATPVQVLVINTLLGGSSHITDAEQNPESEEIVLEKQNGSDYSILSDKRPVLIAAETGSGKTLSYLLPIMQFIKAEEDECIREYEQRTGKQPKNAVVQEVLEELEVDEFKNEEDPDFNEFKESDTQNVKSTHAALSNLRQVGYPRYIVLLPKRELVNQTFTIAKALSHTFKCRVIQSMHGVNSKLRLESDATDILLCTPDNLVKLINSKVVRLNNLRGLVVDEADSLLNDEFDSSMTLIWNLIRNVNEKRDQVKVMFAGATYTQMTMRKIRDVLALLQGQHQDESEETSLSTVNKPQLDMIKIATPAFNKPPAKLKHKVLPLPPNTTKQTILFDHLTSVIKQGKDKRILVFCYKRATVQRLTEWLKGKGLNVMSFTKEVDSDMRMHVLKMFNTAPETSDSSSSTSTTSVSAVPSPNSPLILITTDTLSRGVDTHYCSHVINYDFPKSAIEFLHRVGRTCREGGRNGWCLSIVDKKDKKYVDPVLKGSGIERVKRKQAGSTTVKSPKYASDNNSNSSNPFNEREFKQLKTTPSSLPLSIRTQTLAKTTFSPAQRTSSVRTSKMTPHQNQHSSNSQKEEKKHQIIGKREEKKPATKGKYGDRRGNADERGGRHANVRTKTGFKESVKSKSKKIMHRR